MKPAGNSRLTPRQQIARLAGEQMIEVEPARIPNDERHHPGWRFASGLVTAVPRRDLEQFEAAKARHAAAEAEREEARLAEQAAVERFPSGPCGRWRTPKPPRGRLTFLAGLRALRPAPPDGLMPKASLPSAGPGRPGPHKARPDAAPDPEQHSRPTKSEC